MTRPTEYTFTRPDGTQVHHIVDPDCGTSVMEQIGMFSRMEGATSAVPTNDRDRQITQLRAASPMRGKVEQHDAGDLGLFRAANEPRLI